MNIALGGSGMVYGMESLQIKSKGILQALAKTETGKNKVIEFVARGVEGMRQCLFSVPAFVREGCEVHFAPELNGGSWLKIPSEVERLPIENVDGKHFSGYVRATACQRQAVSAPQANGRRKAPECFPGHSQGIVPTLRDILNIS